MESSQSPVKGQSNTQDSSTRKQSSSRHHSFEQKPTIMKAAFIEKFGEPLIIKEIPVPKPASGQLLVRVEASPINPSDIGLIKGAFTGQNELPLQVGFEGAGTVVASGGGFVGRFLVGSRVAFANGKHPGTWAEYTICDTFSCIPLDKDLPVELEACAIMNPVTALALVEMIKKEKHKAIVQTAAASSLGRMLLKLLKEEKIKTISIVRKEEQKKILEELGAEIILNSEAEGFEEDLRAKANEIQATCCLECVGGDFTSQILKALPVKSTCYIYGLLSEDPVSSIDFADLIANHKAIKSFITSDWLDEQGIIAKVGIVRKVQKMIKDELKTDISQLFSLEEVNEAIKYYTEHMGEGIVILKLNNIENKGEIKERKEEENQKLIQKVNNKINS